MKKYFDQPTQVMFTEDCGNTWEYGIAYRDEIICMCCGAIVSIEELYEFAAEDGYTEEVIKAEDEWINITEDWER